MIETNAYIFIEKGEINLLKKGKKNEYKTDYNHVFNLNKHVVIYDIVDSVVEIIKIMYVISNAYVKLTHLTYTAKLAEYYYYDQNQIDNIFLMLSKKI